MILIVSSETDKLTNDIIDWLIFSNQNYLKLDLNTEVLLEYIDFEKKEVIIKVKKSYEKDYNTYNLNLFTSYWYRRDGIVIHYNNFIDKCPDFITMELKNYQHRELSFIESFFHSFLEEKKGFGKIGENLTNKLYNLTVAEKTGLAIPKTYCFTNIQQLSCVLNDKKLITKSIGTSYVVVSHFSISTFTNLIDANHLYDFTFPSLFQEIVRKKYELRIFHLDGKNFGSAIFSQSNEKTSIDFRKYDLNIPNRVIPYNIPDFLNDKINVFMKKIDMKSGSLDIIVNENDEFVFLEVNPVGQFKQVSYPCNYFLEKIVSDYLSNEQYGRN